VVKLRLVILIPYLAIGDSLLFLDLERVSLDILDVDRVRHFSRRRLSRDDRGRRDWSGRCLHRQRALGHRLPGRVLGNAPEASLVVGETVNDDKIDTSRRPVVGDDEVLAMVDVFVVVVPADVRRWDAGNNARHGDLTAVCCDNVLKVLGEVRRHWLWLGCCKMSDIVYFFQPLVSFKSVMMMMIQI